MARTQPCTVRPCTRPVSRVTAVYTSRARRVHGGVMACTRVQLYTGHVHGRVTGIPVGSMLSHYDSQWPLEGTNDARVI